ncbi:putative holin [Cronobacter sakazakii]|uniref:putative holin n=1 Tax=Cronobacter sakazakii TaxID=28141 RepID=UPI000CF185BF|nr:putative holin [Cronobacter sakazakii]PPX99617.1 hypothetical protein C3D66_22055 [Cronobacter sakazakii]
MTEPVTVSAGFATGTVGITIATFFPEATPAVMLCSLGGAALYVLSADEHEPWKQIIFAIISFIGGMYCAGTAADIITPLINAALHKLTPPVAITVSRPIGALVASTISVAVLLRVLARYRTRKGEGSE